MTCIVGFIDKNTKKVFMGADSAGVAGSTLTIRRDPKIFKIDEFIIGCTSSFRMIQLLRFSFQPPEIKCWDVYEYMCTEFVNAVRECFKNGGFLQKEIKGDEVGGTFLVGYKDRLFQIEDDFQVGESLNGIDAVGCGAEYALGALYSVYESSLDPEEKILIALKAAEFYSTGVSGPFVTFET